MSEERASIFFGQEPFCSPRQPTVPAGLRLLRSIHMTRQEISERYCVSAKVLDAYERCLAGNKDVQKCSAHHHYTEQDLAQISLLLTLHDLGFSSQEAQEYMRLCQCRYETSRRRLAMLEKRRADFLEEIHRKEKQLDRLDYLRYQLMLSQNNADSNSAVCEKNNSN